MGTENHLLSEGQRLAVLVAGQRDRQLDIITRARAALSAQRIEARKESAPALVLGASLTVAGREAIGSIVDQDLRGQVPSLFPAAVALFVDDLRRDSGFLGTGSGVAVAAVEHEGRAGYRVTWDGDGWRWFSRQSDAPEAEANRAVLEAAALAVGLVPEPEAGPTLLVVEPPQEITIRPRKDRDLSPLEAIEARLEREQGPISDVERELRAIQDRKRARGPMRVLDLEKVLSLPDEELDRMTDDDLARWRESCMIVVE